MLEIKNDNLIIGKKSTSIDEINMIQSAKGKLFFSNSIVEISKDAYDINEVYNELKKAGYSNFVLLDNAIVNVENINEVYIKYYQYAGISIFQCNKENAEMYMVVIACKNGKSETISFSSEIEAEKCCDLLNTALNNFKSNKKQIGLAVNLV